MHIHSYTLHVYPLIGNNNIFNYTSSIYQTYNSTVKHSKLPFTNNYKLGVKT